MCVVAFAALPAAALALPDGRGYELVTPLDKNAQEVGAAITGTDPSAGNAVNWEAIGGCCGATSAASTLYQSSRTAGGWQTTAKTPTPPTPLVGLFAEQQPMWWSADLSKTVYLTPARYDTANDARPPGPGETVFFDLYEQDASRHVELADGTVPDGQGHQSIQRDVGRHHAGREQHALHQRGAVDARRDPAVACQHRR